VSPRQVQVWFQNKRQRERKISRALGLFSTPGLPDTPAATAAKVAAELHASCSATEDSSDTAIDSGASATMCSAKDTIDVAGNNPQLSTKVEGAGSTLSSFLQSSLPMTRAVSCPGTNGNISLEGKAEEPPTSLDDTQIPLGLTNNTSEANGSSKDEGKKLFFGRTNSLGTSPTCVPGSGKAAGASSKTKRQGHSFNKESTSSTSWLTGLQDAFPEQAKQAEIHCRAAVAAARAAMDGNTSSLNNASLALMANMGLRLPVLQSLMPPLSKDADDSMHGETAMSARSGSLDISVDDLPDDIGRQLEAELLEQGSNAVPELQETMLTADVLLERHDSPFLGSDSPSQARRMLGGRPWMPQMSTIKKRAVPRDMSTRPESRPSGIPLLHSGVSGLLDDMSMDHSSSGDGIAEDHMWFHPGDGQMTDAEASKQAAADEYVQVITSAAAPFPIVFASAAWMTLCEFDSQNEVIGQTLDLIEGPLTLREKSERLMASIRTGQPCSLNITHHTRSGKPFSHDVRLEPLRDSQGKLHCFQATSSNIIMLDAEGVRVASEEIARANAKAAATNTSARTAHGDDGSMSRNNSELHIHDMLDLFNEAGQKGESCCVRL